MFLLRFFLFSMFFVTFAGHGQVFAARKPQKMEAPIPVVPMGMGNKPFDFIPPKKWQCIEDKEGLPSKVEVVFVGAGKKGFTPSINIATENTELSLEQYVALAKKYHESQPETLCRNLGPMQTKNDSAELLQINKRTQWGNVRFLQAALIREKKAYVITATCLEEDFASFYPQFLQSFQSFDLKGNQDIRGSLN